MFISLEKINFIDHIFSRRSKSINFFFFFWVNNSEWRKHHLKLEHPHFLSLPNGARINPLQIAKLDIMPTCVTLYRVTLELYVVIIIFSFSWYSTASKKCWYSKLITADYKNEISQQLVTQTMQLGLNFGMPF